MQRPPAGQNLAEQGRREHQVVQVGAGKATWVRVVHPQQLAGAAALGAKPSL
jgi:hypothetical protein